MTKMLEIFLDHANVRFAYPMAKSVVAGGVVVDQSEFCQSLFGTA